MPPLSTPRSRLSTAPPVGVYAPGGVVNGPPAPAKLYFWLVRTKNPAMWQVIHTTTKDKPTGFATVVPISGRVAASRIISTLKNPRTGSTPGGGTVPTTSNLSGNLSYNQLQQLWINNGGNPTAAPMAAAIAMAESRGRQNATDKDSNGTIDRGYWQINSVHGQSSTFDPNGNAQAAVAISNDGTDWSPWVTYQTGAYKQFLGAAISAANAAGGGTTTPSYGGTRPGGGSGGSGSSETSNNFSTILTSWDTQRQQDMGSGTTEDVSLLGDVWGAVTGVFSAPVDVFSAATDVLRALLFILTPWHFLQVLEVAVGGVLMAVGLHGYLSSGSGGRSQSDLRRITRDVAAFTPVGRASNVARGRRMGRREGQIEHGRLAERKAERKRLGTP